MNTCEASEVYFREESNLTGLKVTGKKLNVIPREVYEIRVIPFDRLHPSYATVGRVCCLSQPELGTHLKQRTDWAALNISEEQLKLVDSNPIS